MEPDVALQYLIEKEVFIPQWIKDSYKSGLSGGAVASQADLNQFLNTDISLVFSDLKGYDIHLDSEDKKALRHCDGLAEVLISTSLRHTYGWGLPSQESICAITDFLKNYEGLIEPGAGSGLWVGILRARTDKNILGCELNLRPDTPRPRFSYILEADVKDLIQLYPQYPVLLVWPDINQMGNIALEEMSSSLILTGPESVTANREFYQTLDSEFDRISEHACMSFSGLEQSLHILKKLPKPKMPESIDNYFSDKRQSAMPKFKKRNKF